MQVVSMRFVEHIEGDGSIIFNRLQAEMEGIVSKRRDMPYRSGPPRAG
jgi:ATP-dependent DNA ligase